MPLYEYECTVCGHRVEMIQRVNDAPLSECPQCGESMKKLISAPSFQFKGTGWYVTDYASKGSAKDSGEPKKDPAKGEKPAASKSDSGSKSKSPSSPKD
jgi:putative FmdB family regulatory protein